MLVPSTSPFGLSNHFSSVASSQVLPSPNAFNASL